ncbi:hypothetical protein BH09BAC5_BH09BAC5_15490 [soil metagenome]
MKFYKRLLFVFAIVSCSTTLNAQDQYAWQQLSHIPAVGRHRSCGCSIGNRGYIGLGHINNWNSSINYPDWWEYDPGTDSWMQKANFPTGGRYHSIAFSIGNFAYVGTGSDWNGDHDDMWKYSPATNMWTPIPPCPGGVRSGAVAFTINGKGYVALGDYQQDCWQYDPNTNVWTVEPPALIGGYSSVVAVYNGKAYMGVGQGTSWQEFDPATQTWTMKATYPGLYRFGSGCFEYDGWIYVVSGSDWYNEYSDVYAFNPQTNIWVQVSDFPGQARHYFTCFKIGNRIFGGTGTNGTNFNDWWEFGNISAVNELSDETAVHVFPNPVVDIAEFDFQKDMNAIGDFTLTDLNGRKISNEIIPAGPNWIFHRNSISSGTYFYTITTENKILATGKIILQ